MKNLWRDDGDAHAMWDVTLRGGPFDGDDGVVDHLPDAMWVRMCPRCGGHVAWFFNPTQGAECYRKHEVSEQAHAAIYVWGGMPAPDLECEEEKELVLA